MTETNFDDIRPYSDEEVAPAIARILDSQEFVGAIAGLRFPRLTRWCPWIIIPLVRRFLKKQLDDIKTVKQVQQAVAYYMGKMIDKQVSKLTISGLDLLNPRYSYLFISNHRDIVMDPAFVGWALHHDSFDTVRIAIGDNLLSKPFVEDLMRINKSFIVKRSAATRKEKFRASKHLSEYILHSLTVDKSNIWLAQREGRAKDGRDITNAAIISMLALSRDKKTQSYAEHIKTLRIVPVSISYEWDPCDQLKARELHTVREHGNYQKQLHEDITSIAQGIAGKKGAVHIAFGEVLKGDFETAEDVAAEIDRQIWEKYVLHASNHVAYEALHGHIADAPVTHRHKPFKKGRYAAVEREMQRRLDEIPVEQRDILLEIYANPVTSKLQSLHGESESEPSSAKTG